MTFARGDVFVCVCGGGGRGGAPLAKLFKDQ